MGVNHHIRAGHRPLRLAGYLAIAPAVFDRAEPGFEAGYDGPSIQRGIGIAGKIDRADNAARRRRGDRNRQRAPAKSASSAIASAARSPISRPARLSGLGGGVRLLRRRRAGGEGRSARMPTMLHFGTKDAHIPLAGVREFEAAHPDLPVYVYEADHGFNCDERGTYDAPSAALARTRTLEFFKREIG